MLKVVYFLPTKEMYGDNKALLNLLPFMVKDVKPLFIVFPNSTIARELKERGYDYIECTHTIKTYKYNSIRANLGLLRQKLIETINRSWFTKLKEVVSEFSPSLIHSNSSNSALGYYLANSLGIPHVWHIREYGDLDNNVRYFPTRTCFVKRLRSKNNYNITITKSIKDYFELGENTFPIYDGPIIDEKPPLINSEKKKNILFVGRLENVKGVHLAIEAFAIFHKAFPDYRLQIVGDSDKDSYKSWLKEITKHYSLHDFVDFLGYRKDVLSLMSTSSMLLVPSQHEAFGFITAEAMYAGCPVIGMNTGGTKEQFDNIDEHFGYNYSKRFVSVEQLEEQMRNEAQKPSTLHDLASIQECVSSLYSARNSAMLVCNLYKKILN